MLSSVKLVDASHPNHPSLLLLPSLSHFTLTSRRFCSETTEAAEGARTKVRARLRVTDGRAGSAGVDAPKIHRGGKEGMGDGDGR